MEFVNINSKWCFIKTQVGGGVGPIDIFNLVKILNPSVGRTRNIREIALGVLWNFSIFYVLSRRYFSYSLSSAQDGLSLAYSISPFQFRKLEGRSAFISSISNHGQRLAGAAGPRSTMEPAAPPSRYDFCCGRAIDLAEPPLGCVRRHSGPHL